MSTQEPTNLADLVDAVQPQAQAPKPATQPDTSYQVTDNQGKPVNLTQNPQGVVKK